MNHDISRTRQASIAIAAVLALSTAPAFAQAAPVELSAPPPAPVVSPATAPMAMPAAPMAATPAAPVTLSSPPPAPVTTPTARAMAAPTAPVATSTDDDAAPTASTTAHHARAVASAKRTETNTPTSATPAKSVTEPVVAKTPAPEPVSAPVAPAAVAAPAPAPVAPASATAPSNDDDVLPLAGIGGVAALIVAGGAFALGRRRRVTGEAEDEVVVTSVEPEPVPVAPVAAARTAAPVATASTLPDGVDLSRYGRHVQAAYRGPTADNPSLSLKTRLKRARFFDLQERRAAEAKSVPPQPVPAQAARADRGEQIVTRVSASPRRSFRPAFQN